MGESEYHISEKLNAELDSHQIQSGEKIVLRCSNCNTDLVEVWITRPDATLKTKIRAQCWRCGDSSYEKTINGLFHLGHVESEQSQISDVEADIIEQDGELLQIIKVKTNG